MTEIKHVGVLSLAKILGLIYGLIGLFVWLIMGCFLLLGIIAQPTDSPVEMMIIVPFFCFLLVLYGVIGIIAGGVIGLVYNAVAGRLGGIEVELSPRGDNDAVREIVKPV